MMAAQKSKGNDRNVSAKTRKEKPGFCETAGQCNLTVYSEGLDESVEPSYQEDPHEVAAPVRGRKRPSMAEPEEEGEDFPIGGDVRSMLERFGADIRKALLAKRKRLENCSKSSLKTSNEKIEQIWKAQQNDRNKLNDDYSKQFTAVFQQWESDINKSKDQEDKLESLFRQQQKLFQQMRVIQGQRLKTLKQLFDQYIKAFEEMEKTHITQHSAVQNELRKEMALFQKKILMDTQQQEMATVRKSLQSILM